MSENAITTVETPAGKLVAKATNGRAKAKKPVKPAAKKSAAAKDRSAADVPARDRRVALVKLLRKMQATSATAAKPVKALAERLGYNDYDVYCLAYHKYPLAAAGLVKTVQVEGVRGLSVHLTAKGAKAGDDQIP